MALMDGIFGTRAERDLVDPTELTWPEVDPARHPFDPDTASALIRALPPTQQVPTRPVPKAWTSEELQWSERVGDPWARAMSTALVQQYGRWACGWHWGVGESDFDGGPINNWCCTGHSMSNAEATVDAVIASLLEWRGWLEQLAERFEAFLPLPAGATDDQVADVWERAVAHLVTVVVERTEASSGWYTHCEQVLSWFLTAAGVPPARHEKLLEDAIDGRFLSWEAPDAEIVADVAGQLAGTILSRRDA